MVRNTRLSAISLGCCGNRLQVASLFAEDDEKEGHDIVSIAESD
jgi:hypothetical protein